jgi:putative transposase
VEICSCDGPTENGDFMAAETIQAILVELVAVERTRTPPSEFGDPEAGPTHGCRESTVGRAPCVHGELLKLGFEISERTVSRLMPKKDRKPSQTWMTFLRNHVGQMVSVDFFTVVTIRLQVLYVFLILAHDRRRVLHFNITAHHPTAVWAAQQIVEAFPDDTAPRYLLRDRDAIYGHSFTDRVEGMDMEQVRIAARSPWQNCYVERVIGSIRRECLNQ